MPSDSAPFSSSIAARAEDVRVAFGSKTLLHHISLTVPDNAITAIIGRSGSGKTTLLRAFNRLNECMPGCRTHGSLHIRLGQDMTDIYGSAFRAPALLRARVGMVFQTPDVLPVSIRHNMELPLRHVLRLPPGERENRLRQALADTGLWDEVSSRLNTSAETLSGGQQQRLCLARVLAMHPSMLLLDEPTASLDSVSSRTIETLLATLRTRFPILMVSHSLRQALRLADRLVLMGDGRILRQWDRCDGLPDVPVLEQLLEELPCCP